MADIVLGSRPAYPELQTAAHAVRGHHRQVEESLHAGVCNALNHAIEAGRKLAYAKSLLNHGEWGGWVERNLPGISGRTERLYRQLAAAADAGHLANWQRSANLSVEGALRALTASLDSGDAASGGAARDDDQRRQSGKRDPISRLIDYGEPFALDEQLDTEDLEHELAAHLRDRYPTHAVEWAEWWAERFKEAGHQVREP